MLVNDYFMLFKLMIGKKIAKIEWTDWTERTKWTVSSGTSFNLIRTVRALVSGARPNPIHAHARQLAARGIAGDPRVMYDGQYHTANRL